MTVSYQAGRTLVTVEDHARPSGASPGPAAEPGSALLADAGGGHGLTAMRERAQRAGRHRPGRADRRRVAGRAGGARVTDTPEPGTIRVLIADDQRVVREGLSMLAGLIDDVQVVGTACDGAEAVQLAEAHHPGCR